MKGGVSTYKIRGKHFSFTLIVIVFTTVFLWSPEKKPLVTILSSQGQFGSPESDVQLIGSKDIVIPNYPAQEYIHTHEETEADPRTEGATASDVDSTFITSFEREQNEKDPSLSPENNDDTAADADVDTTSRKYSQIEAIEKDLSLSLDNKDDDDTTRHRSDESSRFSTENKGCNYAKGSWIPDNRHPLYSGFKCKQWLSEMWACRMTQRPDFSYEAYRWQPENCEMPEFSGPSFLKRMQGKTIAFIGDSLGRQQFQSLMCLVTGGGDYPEVQDVGSKYGFVLSPGAARPDGWAFRFPATNTSILYHWSSCLCDLYPMNSTDPRGSVAMHLDRAPSFLQRFLPHLDVIILNTGHHWNRGKVNANRLVMHVGGKPNTNKRLAPIGNAKNFTIHSVVRWLDEQIGSHHPHVKAFFRTISPRHFFNGEWNTGGSCENTTPLARGSTVLQEESSDSVIAGAVRGTRVRLLDITALSQLRDEGHISRYSVKASEGIHDCLHWCLPGIPDTWNEILAAQI